MENKPTYTGKISHSGAQYVQAPVNVKAQKGKSSVKKGNDLRTTGK